MTWNMKRGTLSGASFFPVASSWLSARTPSLLGFVYQLGLTNFCPVMPASSRATPKIPKQSGRCVNILFSQSITTSSRPNSDLNGVPGFGSPVAVAEISSKPSWSSLIPSSWALASMPLLTTPRSSRAPSTKGSFSIELGTVLPGGNQATSSPARTFGAPQTTCTRLSALRSTSGVTPPSSIKQTLSLSAPLCF